MRRSSRTTGITATNPLWWTLSRINQVVVATSQPVPLFKATDPFDIVESIDEHSGVSKSEIPTLFGRSLREHVLAVFLHH